MTPGDDSFQKTLRALQNGRLEEAATIARTAVEANDYDVWAQELLGLALFRQGKIEEAITRLSRAVTLAPNVGDFLVNLGFVFNETGQLQQAIEVLTEAVRIAPAIPAAHNNLGIAFLRQGRAAEALPALETAVRTSVTPDPEMLSNLGRTLLKLSRLKDAATMFRRAAEVRPSPDAWMDLAMVRRSLRDAPGGAEAAAKAVQMAPQDANAQSIYAASLLDLNRVDEAVDAARAAVKSDPRPKRFGMLGNALFRAAQAAQAIESYESGLANEPDFASLLSNRLFALWHDPTRTPADTVESHRAWATAHIVPTARPARRASGGPLRIGYVSADLRGHSVGTFMAPVLQHHDAQAVHVTCYSDAVGADEHAKRLRGLSHAWRDTAAFDDAALAQQVRADEIDVLIDLAAHSAGNRQQMFALRPAAAQVTYLGYPATTGSPAIDAKLTDAQIDPPGAGDALNTERLIRLPSYFLYEAPTTMVVSASPLATTGALTLGSTATFAKLNASVVDLWAKTLAAVPRAVLRLQLNVVDSPRTVAPLYEALARHGVSAGRVTIIPMMPFDAYLAEHARFDVLLDPFPFNNGTVACHALWMGVPTVTLAGAAGVSRVGTSLMKQVGLDQFIADDATVFIEIIRRCADDVAHLREVRSSLRERMSASALMDHAGGVRAIEAAYRDVWQSMPEDVRG